MKATFSRTSALALASAATLALSSCATTGDPSTGGIFWSENKAQDRSTERQSKLEKIERKTGKTQRSPRRPSARLMR